jgi:succinoglycan biosynthesis protein ExoV
VRLYYFEDPEGNFGDDLNPWLWGKLMPGVLDEDSSEILVGIGSILNHRIPRGPVKHVLGSGVGYGCLPKIDAKFTFHAVRGFSTAAALGLSRDVVITDAAVLVRKVVDISKSVRTHEFGFMPSGHSERHYDWEALCRDVGFQFISCHWPVEKVINEITQCRTLISEAMHGAIVADSLRVPWIPIKLDDTVLSFKWKDWLSSLNLHYDPANIIPICDNKRSLGTIGEFKNGLKSALKSRGIWSNRWGEPIPPSSPAAVLPLVKDQLHELVNRTAYLSDDVLVDSLLSRYEEVIQKFVMSHGRSR